MESNNLDLDDIVKRVAEENAKVHDGVKIQTFTRIKRLLTDIGHDLKEANLKKRRIIPSDYKAPISAIYDSVAFMKRLESFSSLYVTTDRPLTALECAMHGWSDTKTYANNNFSTCILRCSDCKGKIEVVRWKEEYNRTILGTQTINDYKNALYQKHEADCPWYHRMCKPSIYSFDIKIRSEGFKRFKAEAKNMLEFASALPKISPPLDESTLDKINYVIQHCEGLMDCGKPTGTTPTHSNYKDAYLLALFGWRSACKLPGVQCDLCFAKQAFEADDSSNDNTFDVVHSHQSYCPWINHKYGAVNSFQPKLENELLSGYKWMTRVVCLEYELLFNMINISSYGQHLQAERTEHINRLYNETEKELKKWKQSFASLTQPL